ncbi:MAG: hypothetical protein HZB91_13575, partial [Elusimicrobia bacterium]|nr:hypothetical protein [Elusimicrobiota bacterium]
PGAGGYYAACGSGGGHGGSGGNGGNNPSGGAAYGSITNPADLGSGGGGAYQNVYGGWGGGAVIISAGGAMTLNGLIAADGGNGVRSGIPYGSGGGAGGTVNLRAAALAGSGTITANGGSGGSGNNAGGGGGGGRVAIAASNDGSSLNLQADNGAGGGSDATSGGAGVIAYMGPGAADYSLTIGNLTSSPQSATPISGATPSFSTITLNNGIVGFDAGSVAQVNSFIAAGVSTVTAAGLSFGPNYPLMLSGGAVLNLTANSMVFGTNSPVEVKGGATLKLAAQSTTGGSLNVRSGGIFQQMNVSTLNFTSVLVEPGGTLTHGTNGSTRQYALNLNVSGDFTLQAGATIAASGLGYAGGYDQHVGYGPGAGGYYAACGSGGGHGGSGGNGGNNPSGGAAYGSITNPADLGSGGG